MSKKIKTTDLNLDIKTSNIEVVEIGGLSFERDGRYPWVDIYAIGAEEHKVFLEQVMEELEAESLIGDNLTVFAMNWYFNNVEIVKKKDLVSSIYELNLEV